MEQIILEGEKICKFFGSLRALDSLDFKVRKGEIFGIAGPNGAGKTVLFNVITKIPYSASFGHVFFKGEDITNLPPYKIVKKGIARTFQTPIVFGDLSVLENVMLGVAFGKKRDIVGLDGGKKKCASEAKQVIEYLSLKEKSAQKAGTLSLLDKKLTMIASALATEPEILMLDEPMAGLNPLEVALIFDVVKAINKDKGITIIIIEHNMRALVGLSETMMILDQGKKIAVGKPEEVVRLPQVIEAYLGVKKAAFAKKVG